MKRVQASGKVSLLVKASRPEIRVFSRTFDRSFHFSWLKGVLGMPGAPPRRSTSARIF